MASLRFLLLAFWLMVSPLAAEMTPPPRFVERLEGLLEAYYPNLKREEGSGFGWGQNTMTFMIHLPLKTGEWQPARPMVGPQRKGIHCSLTVQKGPYQGAAVLPQTFDLRYYRVLTMAPYSKTHDCHLHISLAYPESDIDPTLLSRYQQLVNSFATFLDW